MQHEARGRGWRRCRGDRRGNVLMAQSRIKVLVGLLAPTTRASDPGMTHPIVHAEPSTGVAGGRGRGGLQRPETAWSGWAGKSGKSW